MTATFEVEAVSDDTVDVTVLFDGHPDHTARVKVDDLSEAANQQDQDLARQYLAIWRLAQSALGNRAESIERVRLQRAIDACLKHRAVEDSEPRCFTGCVAYEPYTHCNENSHGNIVVTERCACGAERNVNVNAGVEYGPWGNPLGYAWEVTR